ncbi:uncharacterized protein LOC131311699 [Rhododendron vialii]|uniref:uncharacterized protein LOC131311699 n=1 Tax=Rhododendron vialii TaxID=182163 RepID=UPI00265E8C69|nr:uncharacterized protein LOC131311699 [Rhododendron vialii]
MDRSWMLKDRRSKDYDDGVEQFLNFATIHAKDLESIRCPCIQCGNLIRQPIPEIRNHLFVNGIDRSYRTWIWHGEPVTGRASQSVNTRDFSYQEVNSPPLNDAQEAVEMVEAAYNDCMVDPRKFKKLIEDAEKPLFPGCTKFTKLSALVRLYKYKANNDLTNKGFAELLQMIGDLLPDINELPLCIYEAGKTMAALGMEYEKIHACPNDCVLYRKELKTATSCPTFNTSRWKLKKNSTEIRDGVPAKVLWYFPIIPRFRRMYQSVETTENLTWHAHQRESNGQLHHPADSPQWKLVDHLWPDFASEPRNLRLALSADGINPHRSLSSRYSCWPIILVTYNLPPGLCMKKKFMMLSLLISGPHQPGNDIDVFLEPLIDDLKSLWKEGVEAYDAYKQQHFRLRAVLLWTINDLPAFGNLSGCTVKGYYACPICGEGTCSCRLKHGKKNSYEGHRKFLPRYHPYRKQKKAFNGEQEFGEPPLPLSGEEVLREVEGIKTIWGKASKKRSSKVGTKCWKKKSIFFTLEYWVFLYIRHCLDVMHIEKNVLESIIGTLLQIQGKTKDGINARLDLLERGLRQELAPQIGAKRTYLPPACYTLSREEKIRFCTTLSKLKVPDGYSSNLRNIVSMQDLKLYGLKSHDFHVLMQQLLPVAIRSVLPKEVRYALTRFCFFFNAIYSKVMDVSKLDKIQSELVITLCLLEKYFPPSFFDIMVHLTVHLVREVQLCGPVHFRWMYPFERFMKVLKGYIHNHNRPEGCIAERYIAEEAVEFCAEFLSKVDAIGVPISKNMTADDSIGRPLPGGKVTAIDRELWEQAHLYVLENTTEVQPYIEEHMALLKRQYPRNSKNQKWLQLEHNRTFIYWLRGKVAEELSAQHIYLTT